MRFGKHYTVANSFIRPLINSDISEKYAHWFAMFLIYADIECFE